jgi:hypothetical protein
MCCTRGGLGTFDGAGVIVDDGRGRVVVSVGGLLLAGAFVYAHRVVVTCAGVVLALVCIAVVCAGIGIAPVRLHGLVVGVGFAVGTAAHSVAGVVTLAAGLGFVLVWLGVCGNARAWGDAKPTLGQRARGFSMEVS